MRLGGGGMQAELTWEVGSAACKAAAGGGTAGGGRPNAAPPRLQVAASRVASLCKPALREGAACCAPGKREHKRPPAHPSLERRALSEQQKVCGNKLKGGAAGLR